MLVSVCVTALRTRQLRLHVIHSVHINKRLHSFNLTHFIGKPSQSRFKQNFCQTYIVGIIFIYTAGRLSFTNPVSVSNKAPCNVNTYTVAVGQ